MHIIVFRYVLTSNVCGAWCATSLLNVVTWVDFLQISPCGTSRDEKQNNLFTSVRKITQGHIPACEHCVVVRLTCITPQNPPRTMDDMNRMWMTTRGYTVIFSMGKGIFHNRLKYLVVASPHRCPDRLSAIIVSSANRSIIVPGVPTLVSARLPCLLQRPKSQDEK